MLPLLSFHALAAQRGDGLHPALLALLERRARSGTSLGAAIEPDKTELSDAIQTGVAPDAPVKGGSSG
jgi:hypothetical protein